MRGFLSMLKLVWWVTSVISALSVQICWVDSGCAARCMHECC
mgnify:CR=1 FL=1